MHHEDVRIRFRYERGPVWNGGHLGRFAGASSQLLQAMPWMIPISPLGTSAGLANGALDLPGLRPEPRVRLRAIEASGHALMERAYDREGQLERIDYFDDVSIRYAWNERGWVTRVQVGAERPTQWAYRDDGLATSVTYPDGGSFLFDYTDDQRPSRRVYPDGWAITFHYDSDNRLTDYRIDRHIEGSEQPLVGL